MLAFERVVKPVVEISEILALSVPRKRTVGVSERQRLLIVVGWIN